MRFHLLGLTHLPVSRAYSTCAFTQKVYKMCQMLLSLGHDVFLYGAEGSDAPCTEHIVTHSLQDIRNSFGDLGNDEDIGYNWQVENYRTDFDNKKSASRNFIATSVREINRRKLDSDHLLISMGSSQKPIADGVGLYLTLEFGIGYRGSWAPFRAFESWYLRNYMYGVENHNVGDCVDGKFYDRVIPNYFDPDDFTLREKNERHDYAAFVGRIIHRKGISIAADATRAVNMDLKIAGQGMTSWGDGRLTSNDVNVQGEHLEYVGTVDQAQRDMFMGRARVLLAPTIYMEPFGGVAVEAQLCGTPAITTNYGAFPETIIHGKTGYLCNHMNDFVEALKYIDQLAPPEVIRKHAERYLMDNVRHEFQGWFDDLQEVYLSTRGQSRGWYQVGPRVAVPPPPPKKNPNVACDVIYDQPPEEVGSDFPRWQDAQAWEKQWWGSYTMSFTNTFCEEEKQYEYMELLGLSREGSAGHWVRLVGNPLVLDVGGNAVSFLLKTRGFAEDSVVMDPIEIPQWAEERYASRGIKYLRMKGEDLLENFSRADLLFDEVWIYNTLQHVEDPEKVVRAARSVGKKVRVAEWIDIPTSTGHVHMLKQNELESWFGGTGLVHKFESNDPFGCNGNMWFGVFDYPE